MKRTTEVLVMVLLASTVAFFIGQSFGNTEGPQLSMFDTGRQASMTSASLGGKPGGLYGGVDQGRVVPLSTNSRVLVTGASGFIGMHLTSELASRGIRVTGIDDYTGFYSTDLKHARADKLRETHGISVMEKSACDKEFMRELIREERLTHVVHLGAQPGVRFSVTHPALYIDKNVQCFVSVLEAIVAQPPENRPYLVYASSSSVYGLNRKIPFREADRVDVPANLYGATKRSNEELALAYHNIYGIPSAGCRFFTVYGPWGRPDMAVFKFTDRIMKGQPIQVYNGGKMKRDFTFVDDIVDGIIRVMEWRDAAGKPQVFNLGNNQPEELMDMITMLEAALGVNATIQDAGNSPGEIKATYADLTLARSILGFTPKVSLRSGIERFVEWYKSPERKDSFSYVSE